MFYHNSEPGKYEYEHEYEYELVVEPLRISAVNVTKSAVSCRFGHIYRRNP